MIKAIKYEGTEVRYYVSGIGPAIVLLHGYLESAAIWDPLTQMLETGYRVIAVDLPGHGDSGVFGETHSMEQMAEVVRQIIEKEGERKVLLAGHSLGGYVALAAVERFPEKLWGYVLFHSHPHADSPEAIRKRNREIKLVKAGRKDMMYPANVSMMYSPANIESMGEEVERSRRIASDSSEEGIISLLRGMMTRPSRLSVLERGTVPLLWILGKDDQYFSPEKVTDMVKLPGNGFIRILEKSGHMGFVEQTEESYRLIRQFYDSLIVG